MNFQTKLFTAYIKCNGTVSKKKVILFLSWNSRSTGGDLVFCFAFNHPVHFRPKMAVTLEILSSKAF